MDLRVPDGEIDEDWEEWDPNKSSFRHHVIAGAVIAMVVVGIDECSVAAWHR